VSVLGCAVTAVSSAQNVPLLNSIFQDHAVLQRDMPIRVWGRAAPNEPLSISLDRAIATARADANGDWRATLPAMPAGGPHTLTVKGATRVQTAQDILIGDVWLCSGQSNMQLQVHRSLDARSEIANSRNDTIRLLTIPMETSPTPLAELKSKVSWDKAAPETVPEFSAACFYLARELQKTIAVPMGLINASWGGSKIESWLSKDALRAVGGYDDRLKLLELYTKDPVVAGRRWGETWEAWWRSRPVVPRGDEPWHAAPNGEGWRALPADFGPWESWRVPELESFDGMLWYRTSVTLTAAQAAQEATLLLGVADEVDQTWVNGHAAGTTYGPDLERRYPLSKGMLEAGDNVIVVNVLDTYRSGGLIGPGAALALQLADGSRIPLANRWEYRLTPANLGPAPRTPWESVAGLGMIYNAMIAPFGRLGLRGVAWYQGESNVEEAGNYGALLTQFMADWRRHFEQPELPFLIVQLANYGTPPTRPGESNTAQLREAQRLAVAKDPHAALAVTIDIGERYDIHPANKQDVGRRLARAARHVAFGESIAPSGPRPLSAGRTREGVVVTFGDVEKRLIAYGAPGPIGFELCGATPGSCRYAQAELQGTRVLLRETTVTAPTRVRYCWADSPICTLYDEVPLPAGPFEIAIPSNDAKQE